MPILADIMDNDDIRVLQAGRGISLLPEALQELLITGETLVQHLNGHQPAQQQILRLINHGHAAAAHTFKELVTAV